MAGHRLSIPIFDDNGVLIGLHCSKCKEQKPLSEFHKLKKEKYGHKTQCKSCINKKIANSGVMNKLYMILGAANYRCKNNIYYTRKNIKCLLTIEDIKFLWYRDKAEEMTRPSIDRIDSNKNYCLENCQFIEHSENSGKDTPRIRVVQKNMEGDIVKIHPSLKSAAMELGDVRVQSIHRVLTGERKSYKGFIWERFNGETDPRRSKSK